MQFPWLSQKYLFILGLFKPRSKQLLCNDFCCYISLNYFLISRVVSSPCLCAPPIFYAIDLLKKLSQLSFKNVVLSRLIWFLPLEIPSPLSSIYFFSYELEIRVKNLIIFRFSLFGKNITCNIYHWKNHVSFKQLY